MPRDGAGQAGRSVRWLLLACTLFGLAAMHTIGHAGMRMEAAGHHPAMPGAASAEPAAAVSGATWAEPAAVPEMTRALLAAMPGATSAEPAAAVSGATWAEPAATVPGMAGLEPAAVPQSAWAVPAAVPGAASAEPAGAGGCDGGCAHGPGPAPHGGMAGWSVCLAVLGAVATLILLALLVAPSRRRERPASVADPWAVVSRGPPVRSAGLAVAAVSVLRI